LVQQGTAPHFGEPFLFGAPRWAHSCGCKSRHKLITASEVKRNCMRATKGGSVDRNCVPIQSTPPTICTVMSADVRAGIGFQSHFQAR
jgi:hypothetical protein